MLKGALLSLVATFIAFGQLKSNYYDRYYQVELLEEYDYIIIGAGTTGSVIANRLSAQSNTTVLVVEAGGSGRGNNEIDVPYFGGNLLGSSIDWLYSSLPQKQLGSRSIFYVRGKVAGGSSAMNYMIYNRGLKEDFDGWEEVGATGWAFADVEKYFQKVERAADDLPSSLGRNGKLSLSRNPYHGDFYNFISGTIKELRYPEVDALERGGISEGISRVTYTIFNGIRQSSAIAYLWPAHNKRSNRLHFSFYSLAHKVLLSNTKQGNMRAHGVRFEKFGVVKDVLARKEVIVCGGAINSPQILMLSGIGPKQHLEAHNIKVNLDLAGVGKNFQDHVGSHLPYYGTKYPPKLSSSSDDILGTFLEYLKTKNSPVSYSLQSGVGHFVLNGIDDKLIKPSLPIVETYFSPHRSSEKPLLWITADAGDVADLLSRQNNTFQHFQAVPVIARVKSRGEITLASNNAKDPVVFDPNILNHSDDLIALIEALRFMEKLENTKSFKKYGISLVAHPACVKFGVEIPRGDEYYKCFIEQSAYAFGHACCTNKMGRKTDLMAVVDSQLKVFGVQGLRVADASVMPDIVSGNTQAPCYMIGEKAADMIIKDSIVHNSS